MPDMFSGALFAGRDQLLPDDSSSKPVVGMMDEIDKRPFIEVLAPLPDAAYEGVQPADFNTKHVADTSDIKQHFSNLIFWFPGAEETTASS